MKIQPKYLPLVMIFIGLTILPLIIESPYIIHILIIFFIYAIIASNWDLLMGYAGIFSLGQLSFFVAGGYTSGILVRWFGVSPWLGLFAGGVTAALVGLGLGLPSLRLRGIYVALLTLAFNEILKVFILSFGPGSIFGGTMGLLEIPPFQIGGFVFEKIHDYYLILAIFSISTFLIYKIIRSPVGLAFIALRDSESLAVSRGINAYSCKLLVFTVSAFMTGVAGVLYAHTFSIISLESLSFNLMFLLLAMIVIGGWGRFPGSILGTFTLVFLYEYLHFILIWRLVIIGLMEIIIIVVTPSGLIKIADIIRGKFPTTKGKAYQVR